MQALTKLSGPAAVLPQDNIDTDIIIRIERLTSLARADLGPYAFESWRYRPDGSEDLSFILNKPPFHEAPILIAGRNFGCGSSREGAVWALAARGIRCVIAESFGDIFFSNCFQNGVLPIRLPTDTMASISQIASTGSCLSVDLVSQKIELPDSGVIPFEVDPMRRACLLEGLDDISSTLKLEPVISEWQRLDRLSRSWAWQEPSTTINPKGDFK